MAMKDVLRTTATRLPNKTAFIMGDTAITYEWFNRRVNRLAHAMLEMGLQKGDRVAVLVHNSIEFFEIYMALCKIGGVMVPINNLLREKELLRDFSYLKPRYVFFDAEFLNSAEILMVQIDSLEGSVGIGSFSSSDHKHYEAIFEGQSDAEPEVDVHEDDLMSIFLTSGTTGSPKGVMRTHRHNYINALAGAVEIGLRPDDRALLLFPFYHVTLDDQFCHLLRGATIVIRREGNFNAQEVLALISRQRITICHFVPTMINALLQGDNIEQYDLSAFRLALYAAAPMPVDLLQKALKRMPCGFMQFYGQTETGPLTTVLRSEDHLDRSDAGIKRLASCGRPALHFEVRLLDEEGQEVSPGEVGELVVRGEAMSTGYWELPEENKELIKGGWLHTGDYAMQDDYGYIYIVDRKHDMIISGGKNIYPSEIEEVLYKHPAVLETSVIGVPDDHWGESVKAAVVLKEGEEVTSKELIAFCRKNLASYKKPRSVEFFDDLPKSPTGKILKRELRDEYWMDLDRKI